MFKKTKLVHESLENRQLLAACDTLKRDGVVLNFTGANEVVCTLETAFTSVATDITVAATKITTSLTPTPSGSTDEVCTKALALGYSPIGCFTPGKADFSMILDLTVSTVTAPAQSTTCSLKFAKAGITLPDANKIVRTPAADNGNSGTVFGVPAKHITSSDKTFATFVAGAATAGATTLTALTYSGSLGVVWNQCDDGTYSIVEVVSLTGTPANVGALQNALVPNAIDLAKTGTAVVGALPTLTIAATGFTEIGAANPSMGKAFDNSQNTVIGLLNTDAQNAIYDSIFQWTYGNRTDVKPIFG